jgi:hypothetical protein
LSGSEGGSPPGFLIRVWLSRATESMDAAPIRAGFLKKIELKFSFIFQEVV